MLPKTDIEQYGGKGAILNHIRDNCPELPIPDYTYDPRDFARLRKPVIVRSSSPHEYSGFEGIFESVPDVTSESSLEHAMKKVQNSAMGQRAQEYARVNGFEVDERMRAIIQEQPPCTYKGAIMRLPNDPDVIVINYYAGGRRKDHYYGLYSEREGRLIERLHGLSHNRIDFGEVPRLVEAYKKIEALREIAEGYSLYVEFGLDPFYIFQARPFKKIETADFDVPFSHDGYYLCTDLCLGITPPDGVQLPLVRSLGTPEAAVIVAELLGGMATGFEFSKSEVSLRLGIRNAASLARSPDELSNMLTGELKKHHFYFDRRYPEGYCLMISSAIREDYDVDLTVPNMQTFIQGESETFLVHGIIRLLKKASVSLLTEALLADDFFVNVASGATVRVISNGKEAIVFQE